MKLQVLAVAALLTSSAAFAQGPAGGATNGAAVPSAETITGGVLGLIFAPSPRDRAYAEYAAVEEPRRYRRRKR